MSNTTKRRLNKFADVLEAVATNIINAIWLVITDFFWGKAKYRKRERQPRQPRMGRERVIIRPSAPRLYVVDKRK